MLNIKGNASIVLYGKDGNIKAVQRVSNTITNRGFDYICQRIGEYVEGSMIYAAIGKDGTAPSSSDLSLKNEAARVSGTYNHITGSKVFTNESIFGAGAVSGTFREAGLFNAPSKGIILNRVTFDDIVKGTDDILTLEWEIALSEV